MFSDEYFFARIGFDTAVSESFILICTDRSHPRYLKEKEEEQADILKNQDEMIAECGQSISAEAMLDESGTAHLIRKRQVVSDIWVNEVQGRAEALGGCTPGTRDEGNDGVTVEQFVERANGFIRQRREAHAECRLMPEEHAYLTREEVLALRLTKRIGTKLSKQMYPP